MPRAQLVGYFPEVKNVEWIISPFHANISIFNTDSVDGENEFLGSRASIVEEKFNSQYLVSF